MINCIFEINKLESQAIEVVSIFKNKYITESDLGTFIAKDYRFRYAQSFYARPKPMMYNMMMNSMVKLYKKHSKYLRSQRAIFQKFWNKNVFQINNALQEVFGDLAKLNITFHVKVNLARELISSKYGNTFAVSYKLNNKGLLEECIYQIAIRFWHLQFRKIVGTQQNTKSLNYLQTLFGQITVSFMFRNGPFQKYIVRYPRDAHLLLVMDHNREYLLKTFYDIYINNTYEEYLKKGWKLIMDNFDYYYSLMHSIHYPLTRDHITKKLRPPR